MTPNTKLLKAVSEWSWLVAGCGAAELRITLTDGLVVSLTPPEDGEEIPKPPAGWVLGHKSASYNGTSVRIGRTAVWLVLRVLVEAQGEWVSAADLAAGAWPDYEAAQRTVNNTISLLRKALRDSIDLGDTDPILCEEGSYRLAEGLLS
jgi:hypothetical protein